jgi:hypothetical protein
MEEVLSAYMSWTQPPHPCPYASFPMVDQKQMVTFQMYNREKSEEYLIINNKGE